jgi:hypothetical protein
MGALDHTPEHSLDELARGLANGSVSRRKALKLMGGILAGSVLASVPGIAFAQPTAEAIVRACRNASACCTCTYRDLVTEEVIESRCFTEAGRTCEGRRIQNFQSRCIERCQGNQPPGSGIAMSFACEEERNQRVVCRQQADGERFCTTRRC